jgi:hypothetical protein
MSRLPDLLLALTAGQLSDLFFNHEHPCREKLYAGIGHKPRADDFIEQEYAAVREDAKAFCLCIGIDNGHPYYSELPDLLAADFMERL